MEKYKCLNGEILKWIAIVTMLLDHFGAVFANYISSNFYWILRTIGRLAFPIFCFLLVEGFLHTKNVKKYAIRLGIFALISEIPFDLATSGTYLNIQHQNVFFTLFIGLLVLIFFKKYEHVLWSKILILFAGCFLAIFLRTDYNFIGILIIISFYLLREQKINLVIAILLLNLTMGQIQAAATLALIPIFFYNEKRGRQIKYFFYAFYPVHLYILYLIHYFLFL